MWWIDRWVSRRPDVVPDEAELDWEPGKGEPEDGEKCERLWKFSWIEGGKVWYQCRNDRRTCRMEWGVRSRLEARRRRMEDLM